MWVFLAYVGVFCLILIACACLTMLVLWACVEWREWRAGRVTGESEAERTRREYREAQERMTASVARLDGRHSRRDGATAWREEPRTVVDMSETLMTLGQAAEFYRARRDMF